MFDFQLMSQVMLGAAGGRRYDAMSEKSIAETILEGGGVASTSIWSDFHVFDITPSEILQH